MNRTAYTGTDFAVAVNGHSERVEKFCVNHKWKYISTLQAGGRSAVLSSAINAVDGGWMVWIEPPTLPRHEDWLRNAIGQMRGVAHLGGCICWKPLSQSDQQVAKSAPWYNNAPFQNQPFNASMQRAFYPMRGMFIAAYGMLKRINWPDNRLPNSDLDLMLGVAAHQHGYKMFDVARWIEIL